MQFSQLMTSPLEAIDFLIRHMRYERPQLWVLLEEMCQVVSAILRIEILVFSVYSRRKTAH